MTWYKKGLRFKCTGCGDCCSKEPGYVWLSPIDIERISAHLEISQLEFIEKYTRFVFGRYSLIEKKNNYDCIFLKDKKCQIYPFRPKQCKTFPWWSDNLESPKSWKQAAKRCEGINHEEATTFTPEMIEKEARGEIE